MDCEVHKFGLADYDPGFVDAPRWVRVAVRWAFAAALAYITTPLAIRATGRLAFYDAPFGY